MLKKAVCLGVLVALTSALLADDPITIRPRQVVKQRVDPKLLKEALNLPEYQGQPPETTAAMLDDLQKLSDKLRKSGDTEAADLIDRFIVEHKRVVGQLQAKASAHRDRPDVVLKVVEVNLDDIPLESILHHTDVNDSAPKAMAEKSRPIVKELELMVSAKRARVLINPALRVRSDGHPNFHPADEFPVPFNKGMIKFPFHDYGVLEHGVTIEATPTLIDDDQVRLQSTCDFSLKHTDATGFTPSKVQCTFELKRGETVVLCSPVAQSSRHRWFVIYKFLPQS